MQNDTLHKLLQDKMDGFAVLPPGSSFNSHAAWQKLEQRLPARRKKYGWYYMAAAVLLLICCATYLYQRGTTPMMGKRNTTNGTPAATQVQSTAITPPVMIPEQEKAVSTKSESLPVPGYFPAVQDSSVATASIAVLPLTGDSTAAVLPVSPATDNIVIHPVSPQPGIRIIHLNDLADDPYHRETEKKSRSNFSVTNPFKKEKNIQGEAPEQPRLKLPIIIN